MKIYTKMGDQGETTLASGKKVSKSNLKVDLYGTCDELNSALGLALSFAPENLPDPRRKFFLQIQSLLFEIGSELAGYIPQERLQANLQSILEPEDTLSLEKEIDTLTESLIPLKSFVLPGGTRFASHLHLARTICRRLERDIIRAVESGEEVSEPIRIYLNRLSDYLFTFARYGNSLENVEEPQWKSRTK